MMRLGNLLVAAWVAMALAASPALAQQGGQGGMMSKNGPDQGQGMMGKGAQGRGRRGQKGHGMMMGRSMMDQDGKPGGQGMMDCPMTGKSMMNKGMGKGMMNSRPMMEAHLAYIKADLEITDAQEDAWNGYADAVRAGFTAMESPREAMIKAMKGGNAVERMDARIKATETRLENLRILKPATEALYDVLTDDQKEKADKLLGSGCGMM
jgi:hypothetical protein